MRALLLAGGLGTRLRPITDTVPKCLVPVLQRPLLDYWLDLLFEAGIERTLVNTHYLADKVRAYIASSRWRDRIDLVHEPELLGTGGTIRANRAYFGDESFLVAHADNLAHFDIAGLIEAHHGRPQGTMLTMLAFRTDDPSSCGILELDARGVVQSFHEKTSDPPGNLANAAIYVMAPEVLAELARFDRPLIDLSTELIPRLMGGIFAVETSGYLRDIGNAESLRQAHLEYSHWITIRAAGQKNSRDARLTVQPQVAETSVDI
jgi:mannose-1-phosphate guanylyltransferase